MYKNVKPPHTHTHKSDTMNKLYPYPFRQIIFDAFSVGRFDEGLIDADADSADLSTFGDLPGCPDGFMQVSYALRYK